MRTVDEILHLRDEDRRRIRWEWWSYESLVDVLRPYFAYRVGGVGYRVTIVHLGGARITFAHPEPPAVARRPITEMLRTRAAGEALEDCPVCQEAVLEGSDYALMPCGHTCCQDCLQEWVNVSTVPNCPLCRTPLFERRVRQRVD